jgi:sarcosine oxidase subunit beta
MRMAKRQGVTYEVYNRVTGIEKNKGAFTIQTPKGTFGCKTIIISAGPHASEIGKMLAIDIPVRPVRGQAMITEAVAPLFRHTIFSGVRQMVNGEVFVGSSKEEGQPDRSTTLDFLGRAAELGIKKVPKLATARVIRSFAGLRPMPKDGHPILGPVPGVENLFVAAMHSGVTLSPLVGTLMTELLCNGETSIPIERLSITRFA